MTFDVNAFMYANTEQAADTSIVPAPPGEYNAILRDPKLVEWTGKEDKSGLKLRVFAEIVDPVVVEATGRNPTRVRGEIMLDLTENKQALDYGKGKNVRLGRLREACGLNEAGKPFNFAMLDGKMVRVKVVSRPDKDDSSILYDDIGGFAPLGQ